MNNTDKLKAYVEEKRVWGSEIVYSSNGTKESGHYITSKAAEIASKLYMGTHTFKDVKNDTTEIWFFGKHISLT